LVTETNTEANMKTIFLLKHNDSVDGVGPSRVKFACADRETIVKWLEQKYPAAQDANTLMTTNRFTYMYDSYTVEDIPLVDLEDVRRAPDAAARVKELKGSIATLQEKLDNVQKLVL
jgi:hypothetical protein